MSESAEIVWQGRFITVRRRGTWEYVGRARDIHAAVILALIDGDGLLDDPSFPPGWSATSPPARRSRPPPRASSRRRPATDPRAST